MFWEDSTPHSDYPRKSSSINLSTYQLTNLSTYQLTNLSIYQLINLFTYQLYTDYPQNFFSLDKRYFRTFSLHHEKLTFYDWLLIFTIYFPLFFISYCIVLKSHYN